MVVFAAPFSQVSGHLLPFQADELNPSPVDQGLVNALFAHSYVVPSPGDDLVDAGDPRLPVDGSGAKPPAFHCGTMQVTPSDANDSPNDGDESSVEQSKPIQLLCGTITPPTSAVEG